MCSAAGNGNFRLEFENLSLFSYNYSVQTDMGRKGYLNRGTKLAYVLKDKIKNVLIKHIFCPPLLTVKWKGTKTSTATEAANLTSNG